MTADKESQMGTCFPCTFLCTYSALSCLVLSWDSLLRLSWPVITYCHRTIHSLDYQQTKKTEREREEKETKTVVVTEKYILLSAAVYIVVISWGWRMKRWRIYRLHCCCCCKQSCNIQINFICSLAGWSTGSAASVNLL